MNLKALRRKMLRNKKFREEWYKKDLAFEIAQMVLEARCVVGLSQTQLAKRMRTKQSAIARIENGRILPSLKTLEAMAKAMGTYLFPPHFGFLRPYCPPPYRKNYAKNNNRLQK